MTWILLLIFFALIAVLSASTLFLQSYFYTEPTDGLLWRAPLAAAVLTGLLAFWSYLAYRDPGHYDTLFSFSLQDDRPKPRKMWSVNGSQKQAFELRTNSNGLAEYRHVESGKPWSRSQAVIILDDDGKEIRFEADRDAEGNYRVNRTKPPLGLGWLVGPGAEQALQYRDDRGRVMTEDAIGRLSTTQTGLVFGNLFLNMLHFVFWFLCLWLLLNYQWNHALGLAAVFWLIMTIPILPMLFAKASSTGLEARPAAAVE